MSNAVFNPALAFVLESEGGLSLDPADPGNWDDGVLRGTFMGVSAAAYPELDVQTLTHAQILDLYRRDYFEAVGGDTMTPALAFVAFDTAVNAGVGRVKGWLAEGHDTPVGLTLRRLEHYTDLKELYPRYGRGWTKRAVRCLRAALALEGTLDQPQI